MADKLVNGGYVNNAVYFCKWTTWAVLSPHAGHFNGTRADECSTLWGMHCEVSMRELWL